MRIESWNPNKFDESFEDVAIDRLIEASEVIAKNARIKLISQIGKGWGSRKRPYMRITRPITETGKYAGQPWTQRNPGELLASIRVTRKKTKSGRAFSKMRNVRVYAGNYLAYYADIFEFYRPFMRPSFYSSLSQVKTIIGAK